MFGDFLTDLSPSYSKFRVGVPKNQDNPRKSSQIVKRESFFSNDESNYITELKNKAMIGENLGDIKPETIFEVLKELQSDKEVFLESNMDKQSQLVDIAIEKLMNQYENASKKGIIRQIMKEHKLRVEEAQVKLDRANEEIEKQKRELIEYLKSQMMALQCKHKREREEMAKQWSSMEKLRRYNRTSSELRILRLKAFKLRNSRRFDEMNIVETKANDLEKTESELMKKQMEADYQESLIMLKEKQKNEIDLQKRVNTRKLEEFEHSKKSEIELLSRRLEKLKNFVVDNHEVDKIWKQKKTSSKTKMNQGTLTSRTPIPKSKRDINMSEYNILRIKPVSESPVKFSDLTYDDIF